MPMKNDREYRAMAMGIPEEARSMDDQNIEKMVRGYASTFNEPYTLLKNKYMQIDEVVAPDAFEGTDMSDVIFQYDHQGRVFARISNNTLSVAPDERGLLIEANLGGTELGRQLYDEIRGGYTNKMSFGFTVDEEEINEKEDKNGFLFITRTIKHVRKLYDVSAVSLPANDATEISVRNLTDGVIERIQAERLEAEKLELKRRKLLIKIQLEDCLDEVYKRTDFSNEFRRT